MNKTLKNAPFRLMENYLKERGFTLGQEIDRSLYIDKFENLKGLQGRNTKKQQL